MEAAPLVLSASRKSASCACADWLCCHTRALISDFNHTAAHNADKLPSCVTVEKLRRHQCSISCRQNLSAPLLMLEWKGLEVHAHAAKDRLQRLGLTLASCAVQHTFAAPPADMPTSLRHLSEEVYWPCT